MRVHRGRRAIALLLLVFLFVISCSAADDSRRSAGDDDSGDDSGDDAGNDDDDDTGSLAWEIVTPSGGVPASRGFVEAVVDEAEGRMILYGGRSTGDAFLDDVATFTFATDAFGAIEATGDAPPALYGPAIGWDDGARRFYVSGGATAAETNPGVYVLDVDTATWTLAGDGADTLGARQLAAGVWDGTRFLVFGGYKTEPGVPGGELMGDVWAITWDGTPGAAEFAPLPSTGPAPRSNAAACFDAARGLWFLYGGAGGAEPLADLWLFDTHADSWLSLSASGAAPPAVHSARCVIDGAGGRLVLVGGIDGENVELAQTYLLALDESLRWTRVDAPGMPGRYAGAMALDESGDRAVYHGGVIYSPGGDPEFTFLADVHVLRF
jgi:hypothetical protein